MKSRIVLLAAALTLAAPAAHAHRAWMLPSATVLSGEDPWLTVDAAISNDLFYFEHFPMRLDNVKAVGPDGAEAKIENASTGRYRSTFDIRLTKDGTYKVVSGGETVNARYTEGGETKRWRGARANFPGVPAGAQNVQINENVQRVEVFATRGAPSADALKPTNVGLELVPVTHPNDLYAGEEARFRLLLDGQPAANLEVEIVPGGNRYRDALNDVKVKTDAQGVFSYTWPEAGMYWMEAQARGAKGVLPGATRSATYIATLEVLNP